jgi:hypothetical protein
MKQSKLLIFILLPLLLAAAGCGKDDDKDDALTHIDDPSEFILGKWQEIACGNAYFPELPPRFYTVEFLPDGTYYGPYGFDSSKSDGLPAQFHIASDSLFLQKEEHSDYIYQYIFIGKNQLLANLRYGVILHSMNTPLFHIFERIK